MGYRVPQGRALAITQILLSGFCFGFLGIWGKWAFQLGLQPGEFLAVRFSLAFLILFSYLLWRNRKTQKAPWLSTQHLIMCILLGIFGYAVFASCYFTALKGLSASMAVLLLYLYPVFVAIGARLFLKEHLGLFGLIALPIASIGLTLLVWGDFSIQNLSGFIVGVLSAVVYAVYILISRKYLGTVEAMTSSCWMQFGTGLSLMLVNFRSLDRLHEVIVIGWQPILGIAIFSTILSMTLFLQALKKLRSTEVSILSTSEPITAILMAYLILGEKLTLIQIVGGALVITAMLLIAQTSDKTSRLPDQGHG